MEKFERFSAIAAPMPAENVDTDQIIPSRFLKTIKRTGLGQHAFAAQRYDAQGKERPEFILNQEPFRKSRILITLDNFGCGSSREHAPWALLDFGLRCVIAPSFADIFHSNCFKNGILPIQLPREVCLELMACARLGANAYFTVDLEKQVVIGPEGDEISFDVDPLRRQLLLDGLDDIGQTMKREKEITAFEAERAQSASWLPPITNEVAS